jgi:hypothetical protein
LQGSAPFLLDCPPPLLLLSALKKIHHLLLLFPTVDLVLMRIVLVQQPRGEDCLAGAAGMEVEVACALDPQLLRLKLLRLLRPRLLRLLLLELAVLELSELAELVELLGAHLEQEKGVRICLVYDMSFEESESPQSENSPNLPCCTLLLRTHLE